MHKDAVNIFTFIKSRVAIMDTISEYVTLKKAGLYYKGRCPFHHERTGSFTVSPHRDIFYCFGCHKGGDVIAFIAEIERCTQLEAVKHIAERHGVPLPASFEGEGTESSGAALRRYTQLCSLFASWCHQQLFVSSDAYAYVQERGLSDASLKNFTVGCFPGHQLDALLERLQPEGFIVADLLDAHLLIKGKTGLYSPFVDRILFPIKDYMGRTCGFGGRIFKPGDQRPKYYNSQEHPFFSKGSVLFGLDAAKKAIQEKQTVFLVEGYLDSIAMTQAGYRNTVATLGTACTFDHLKLLARYAHTVYAVYDGDAAGQQALTKLAHLAWDVNMELSVISLPDGEDPASLLYKQADFESYAIQAQDIFVFFIQRLGSAYSSKPLQERMALVGEVLETIALVDNPLKQNFLLQKAATTFSLPLDLLTNRLSSMPMKAAASKPSAGTTFTYNPSSFEHKLFISLLRYHEGLAQEDGLLIQRAFNPPLSLLVEKLLICTRKKMPFVASDFLDSLVDHERQLAIKLMIEGEEEPAVELSQLLSMLWKKEWKLLASNLKQRLAQAEQAQDERALSALAAEFSQLKNKMKEKGIL